MEKSGLSRKAVYTRTDKDGTPNAAGGYVLFGSYPSGRVTEEALLAELHALSGGLPTDGDHPDWISYKYSVFADSDRDFMRYRDILHGGVKYRGVYFTKYRPYDSLSTSEENRQAGNGYHPGRVYWFRYEPVLWRILEERDGKAWLITEHCIDSQVYRDVVWDNSYVRSSVRKWLMHEFSDAAFTESERGAISRERITNNMEDEDVCDGDVPGSDTHDTVHLLSVEEAEKLLPHGARQCVGTEYAACQGLGVNPETGYSAWWLRSPYYSIDSWAQLVVSNTWANPFFDFNTGDVGNTETGIRPALWLRL